ncbi:hydroxyethylthiazole kinase [Trabulsiella odontotermitis]|uniref:hydroxyethylthiazole kinase n=1 Tax=Trabulsiella odontotermitis TaxID=379893 RepID=UPI0024B63FF8|nr:hydroxyethylthiazole kinase [Trabulsiella odontotermitis]WHP29921.1 hydroxyethylthiazole kinase [Trabulsiella odontotermitis]
MPSDLLSPALIAQSLQSFRTRSPLVHCMTNDVVQTFTANVLLALGASPAMVIDPDEAAEFAAVADALLINVGTLTADRAAAMQAAIGSSVKAGKPWTLDPVAVGALSLRTRFCQQSLNLHPTAIRGNASEIMALAGMSRGGRGVDTTDTAAAAVPAAQKLAQQSGAIVAVTGETDYVTDGERTLAVAGGSPLMTRVVGTGCALSAVVAAFCALPGDRLVNVATACGVMKQAGEIAAQNGNGPGAFEPAFLDALYTLSGEVQV